MHRSQKTSLWFVDLLYVAFPLVLLVAAVRCAQQPELGPTPDTVLAATSAGGNAAQLPNAPQPFVSVAKQAKASVVNISATRKSKPGLEPFSSPFFDDPFFRRFFGEEFGRKSPRPKERERQEQGLGSGVIVSQDGYIVTNNHVVEQADELTVALSDKRTFKAKVIGSDPKTDIAVVKIEASNLSPLQWGDSLQLEVGELVLAVGNPFGLSQTVTMGIISAVGRANMGIVDYEDFIQTDAAINPGNSGGALVNLKGELIGINTAIFSRTGGNMGIGFAVPSNMAKSVMQSLLKYGKVIRGWIGVSIQEVTPELAKEFGASDTQGALVGDVMKDSPAEKAKLERGDIITSYNRTPIKDPAHLRSLVAETAPGTTVTLSILREKKQEDVSLTIGELPKNVAEAAGRSGEGVRGEHALAGVTVEDLLESRSGQSRHRSGVVVTDIEANSPAEQAGLRIGDVIIEINRKPIRNVQDFEQATSRLGARSSVLMLLGRGNVTIYLSINPGH